MKTRKLAVAPVAPVVRSDADVFAAQMVDHSPLSEVVRGLEYQIKWAQSELDAWKATFETNPAYAMEWSDSAFDTAAKLEVAHRILKIIQAEHGGYDVAVREVKAQVFRGALYPSHSTSPTTNRMAEARLAAMAEWVRNR